MPVKAITIIQQHGSARSNLWFSRQLQVLDTEVNRLTCFSICRYPQDYCPLTKAKSTMCTHGTPQRSCTIANPDFDNGGRLSTKDR